MPIQNMEVVLPSGRHLSYDLVHDVWNDVLYPKLPAKALGYMLVKDEDGWHERIIPPWVQG